MLMSRPTPAACRAIVCIVALATLLVAPATNSIAQNQPKKKYKTVPIAAEFKTSRAISQAKLVKDGVILGRLVLADKSDEFRKWYSGYQFPRLTLPEYFHEMESIRSDLLKDLRSARTPEVHQFLLDTFFRYASRLCTDDYYPATRVNAMLLIASLNQGEETPRTRPVPYPPAFNFMLAQLGAAKQIDGVRAVALVGIRRHIRLALASRGYTINAAQRDQALAAMRNLINQDKPDTRSAEGHAWMQRRAMESLALLADLNKHPDILQDLAKLIESDDASPMLVCVTAQAVGRLRIPKNLQYDPLPLAQRLGNAAVQVVDREAKRINEKKKSQGDGSIPEGYGGMMDMMEGQGPGGMEQEEDESPYGGGGFDTSDDDADKKDVPKSPKDVNRLRRILKYQLVCILEGFHGPKRAKNLGLAAMAATSGDAAKQAEVTKIADAVAAVLAATDPPDPDVPFKTEEEVLKSVQQKLAELEAALPEPEEPGPEEKPDAESPDDGPGEPVADDPGGKPASDPAGAAGGEKKADSGKKK